MSKPLHRLFGLSLSDFFHGTEVRVELEVDLSQRQQLLDVVIIRPGTSPLPRPLPDGFDELAPHNLVTFKSHQESLDGWAVAELVGHYVNYRKQASPSMQELLAESEFRMYAVSVRHPQNLERAGTLRPVSDGVWDAVFPGVATIRLIVVHQLPKESRNAILHLFSAREDMLRFARDHYRPRSPDTSTLLYQLYRAYQEDPAMAATQLEEFVRESIDQLLRELPPEKRLEGLSAEERLEGLSPEEIRAALEKLERRRRAASNVTNGSSPEGASSQD